MTRSNDQPSQPSITFEKLTHGGAALGRLKDGRVIFGEDVLPDEAVSGTGSTWELRKKQWWLTKPEIQTPSPQRTEPTCRHAKVCGGCDWQHLNEEGQAHWKQQIVIESLQRVGKIQKPNVNPTLTKDLLGYRHRVTWQVSTGIKPQVGYFAKQTNAVVSVVSCPVLSPALEKTLETLNAAPWVLMGSEKIQAQANQKGDVLLSITLRESISLEEARSDWKRWFNEQGTVIGIQLHTPKEEQPFELGTQALQDTWSDATLEYGVGHFMQGHPQAFQALIRWIQAQPEVKEALEEGGTLLDAYCGVGLLGLNLKPQHQPLIGVESSEDTIHLAKKNAKSNARRIGQSVQFYAQRMEQWVKNNPELTPRWAVIDPPRQGLHPAVCNWLSTQVKDTIVYVSCDPATLARDIKKLLDAPDSHWQLKRIQPVDLFPQTHHVESVAILSQT